MGNLAHEEHVVQPLDQLLHKLHGRGQRARLVLIAQRGRCGAVLLHGRRAAGKRAGEQPARLIRRFRLFARLGSLRFARQPLAL